MSLEERLKTALDGLDEGSRQRALHLLKARIDSDDELTGRVEKAEAALLTLKQRGLRVGNGDGGTPVGAERQPVLHGNKALEGFLSASKGRKSVVSFEVAHKTAKLDGLVTKAAITGVAGSGYYPNILGPRQPALRLANLIPEVYLSGGSGIEYSQESSYVPNAQVVPEGQLKPETTIGFTVKMATIKTIATWSKASLQSLADCPDLRDWIDQRLAHAVLLRGEDVILNGADGLLAAATALTAGFTPGTGATGLDVVGGAIAQLESLGYSPDAVVLSGADSFALRGLKSDTGEYLWASPSGPVNVRTVWGVPLVIAPSMPAGQFLVAALEQSSVLFSRQSITVEIAYENEDDFLRNLACIRAEEREALAIPAPSGLVKGSLAVTVAAEAVAPPPGKSTK